MTRVCCHRSTGPRLPRLHQLDIENPTPSVTNLAAFSDREKDKNLDIPFPNVSSSGLFNECNRCQTDRTIVDTALHIAKELKPMDPVTLTHPQQAEAVIRSFVSQFKGKPIYAVKSNPCAHFLRLLRANSITWFDVASIGEIRHVSSIIPDAKFCFMHPVKPKEAIREAYFSYNIRVFSLDAIDELDKILEATDSATDLTLCVRIRTFSKHSKLDLASKFGVSDAETKPLLQATRRSADQLGICFHVGSQAIAPEDFEAALHQVGAVIREAAVKVEIIDVGGGFAVRYPDMNPPPLSEYMAAILRGVFKLPVAHPVQLWAEPGRALSSTFHSLIVRVERRRELELYINDGAYGTLADAARVRWRYFVRLLRDPPPENQVLPFSFFGPTMDSLDFMPGPFYLPKDTRAGDYIEVFGVGAYGWVMRSRFNFFDTFESMVAHD